MMRETRLFLSDPPSLPPLFVSSNPDWIKRDDVPCSPVLDGFEYRERSEKEKVGGGYVFAKTIYKHQTNAWKYVGVFPDF